MDFLRNLIQKYYSKQDFFFNSIQKNSSEDIYFATQEMLDKIKKKDNYSRTKNQIKRNRKKSGNK